jgi:PTH1 family peptidyl-tRNA hydrolase
MDNAGQTRFVVGLGNPGREYAETRHNVGFMVLAELRRRWPLGGEKGRFHALVWDGRIGSSRVVLAAPQTYMNRSGLAVAEMLAFYKAAPADVLVVMDDLALPTGRVRVRTEGSAGGHKGLTDILAALCTDAVPRLRVGIGQPPPRMDAADYVLSAFRDEEWLLIREAIDRSADAVEAWLGQGIEYVMGKFNPTERGPEGPQGK